MRLRIINLKNLSLNTDLGTINANDDVRQQAIRTRIQALNPDLNMANLSFVSMSQTRIILTAIPRLILMK